MGWSRGSYLADDVWNLVKPHIDPSKQRTVARELLQKFCDYDADDWYGRQLLVDAGLPAGSDDWDIDKFWAELRS